jgi:hypothetical protein
MIAPAAGSVAAPAVARLTAIQFFVFLDCFVVDAPRNDEALGGLPSESIAESQQNRRISLEIAAQLAGAGA